MSLSDLLIVEFVSWAKNKIKNGVEDIDSTVFKGLVIIVLWIVLIGLILSFVIFLIIEPFQAKQNPVLLEWILGIWLLLELSHFIGGGHKG